MAYEAKILLDSVSPDGVRLTTMEVTFPRIVLAEFNTHRMLSRNSASSRAIPVARMLTRVLNDPFIPVYWGKNQKGMQASEELSTEAQALALEQWLVARDNAVNTVARLQGDDIDLHKQIANRLLEPWLFHTVIVSATEWDNFFNLRCHKDAQPEIRRVAEMMKELYATSTPKGLAYGEWHLPLLVEDERAELIGRDEATSPVLFDLWKKVSAGRCARVSYLTHDGVRDPQADIELCDRLAKSGHMSPLEHVARPAQPSENLLTASSIKDSVGFFGNFRGWVQMRKTLPNEAVFRE